MSIPRPRRPLQMDKNRRDKIHKESKSTNNLPFTFSKPKRPKFEPWYYSCPECYHEFSVGKNTCMVVCGACKKLISIEENKRVSK